MLDRDPATGGTTFYLLTFQARDAGSRSSEAKLKVTLTDVNDNAPAFSQSVYAVRLACDAAAGTVLTRVSATDDDVTASALTFAFVDAGGSGYFRLDGVTGDVTLESDVTAASSSASIPRALTISASDGGVAAVTSSAVLLVHMDGCSGGSNVTGRVNNDTGECE